MASYLESKAKDAFIDEHFDLAVDLYSQAIDICPTSAGLYVDRAQAYIKLNLFTDAVADANRAIQLDPKMAKAYLRKGTACFELEEYYTARAALRTGASLALEDSRFTSLIKKCNLKIAEESGDVFEKSSGAAHPLELVPCSEVTMKANGIAGLQAVTMNGTAGLHAVTMNGDRHAVTMNGTEDLQAVTMSGIAGLQSVTRAAKPNYRHEYYQRPEEVVVTIFAKHLSPSSVRVYLGEQILSVSINIPEEEVYHFQPRLFGKIVPSKCKYEVLTTKIEIRLAKATAMHWTSLKYIKDTTFSQQINDSTAQGPTYPSSKPKRVDWDKLEAQVKKEEKEEILEGDAGLKKFFHEVYQGGDEESRMAMQKSYVESNGTVLSTNWEDVGRKRVDASTPGGMELKKWEY